MAFADGKEFSLEELRVMKEKWNDKAFKQAQMAEEAMGDIDIGSPIDDVQAPVGEETVTIEIPADLAKDISGQIETATDTAIPEALPDEVELEVEASTGKITNIKVAAKPTKIDKIEKDVGAGIPHGKATLGKEGPDNIDVKENKPQIPTGKATLGKEGPDNIDKAMDLPDIPVDDSKIGGEKETQKGMPGINNEIKGTVIAKTAEPIKKEAAKPTQIEHIEKDVGAGIPRGKATLGKEGPDNIDVKENKPDIPRGNAELGNEGKDNINPAADLPDVPVDDSKIGGEKETQKGMPGINNEIKGTVIAEKREKQLARIADARHRKACQVASKLLGQRRIAEGDFDAVVEDLSKLELERIEAFADRMFRKVASEKKADATLATAIVQQASEYAPEIPKPISLKDELVNAFALTQKLNEFEKE